MLNEPKNSRDRQRALTIGGIFCLLMAAFYIAYAFRDVDRQKKDYGIRTTLTISKGGETIVIDYTDWDSVRVDSLFKAASFQTTDDDSTYKAFGLDELDSMMKEPSSPLVDSFLIRHERSTNESAKK